MTDFHWVKEEEIDMINIESIQENAEDGFILEVDLGLYIKLALIKLVK